MTDNGKEGNIHIDTEEAGSREEEAARKEDGAGAPGGEAAPSCDESEKLRRERDEYLDLLRRTKADFSNYQKRVEENRGRSRRIAQRDLLSRLLVASDQCRLAAKSAREDTSAESLRDAICLVWSEVEKFLEAAGVKQIPTRGESFDPERHEAVMVQTREDVPDSAIVEEVAPGYAFGDYVLRPAQVVVAKRPKPGPAPSSEGAAEGASEAGEGAASESGEGAEGASLEGEAEAGGEEASGGRQ